jgi:hypothetical protein
VVLPETWQASWLTAVEGCGGEEAAREQGLCLGVVYFAKFRVMVRPGSRNTSAGCKTSNARREDLR